MLRPKEMIRVLIVGPLDALSKTIDILHDLQVLHIVDFQAEDDTFRLGRPLEKASEVSESLLKLRSIASVLEIDKVKDLELEEVGVDAQQRLLTLEINIREEDETRKRTEELLVDLETRIEALSPFAALGPELSYYGGYESLEVFVGRLPRELVGLEDITDSWELLREGDALALFVEKLKAEEVRGLLSRLGFIPLEIPAREGNPQAMLRNLWDERNRWRVRLQEVRDRLTTLRERFANFIVSAEDFLTREIEKAEAPLQFATSDHSFLAEGWVPKARWIDVQERLADMESLYAGALEGSEEEEPPVLLDNPKPVKPFEFLTNLFSTPSYKEIDPTLALFFIFPIFFGFMIGDLGYGVFWVLLGVLALRKIRPPSELRSLMAILLIGGIASMFFGGLIFAEAFGIPFHAEGEALSWEGFGIDIPIGSSIHKLTDVADMLIISLIAAVLHLGLGFTIGLSNELKRGWKHSMKKGAWLLILFGLFLAMMARVRWNRIAGFLWRTVLAPIPAEGPELLGMQLPWVALILLLVGIGLLLAPTILQRPIEIAGFLAPIEVAGLLANMISYTRLAGIGIAKAAIAEAFNNEIFHGLLFTGNVGWIVLGAFLLVLAHMMVFGLGAIGAGIQALRLNYVEFFIKFFKGNGVPFKPFGARTAGVT
ncbi:MAG: V-type ATP synthase subunit I [Thermoplasmata archaeon]